MSSVALIGIGKSFGRRSALEVINLEIADGEFMVVVGPSGCGKSTLLRIVAGLGFPSRSAHTACSGQQDVAAGIVRHRQPGFHIDLDLERLGPEERAAALTALRDILAKLEQ